MSTSEWAAAARSWRAARACSGSSGPATGCSWPAACPRSRHAEEDGEEKECMNISRWSRSASDGASGSRSRSRRAGKYLEGEAAGVGEVPDTGHAEVGEVGGGGGSLQV